MKIAVISICLICAVTSFPLGTAKAQNVYTQKQVDQLLPEEIDPDRDGKTGLGDVIHHLQVLKGIRILSDGIAKLEDTIHYLQVLSGVKKQQIQVTESSQTVDIQFSNGVRVLLERNEENGGLSGIQNIFLNNRELLSNNSETSQQIFSLDLLDAEPVGTVCNWATYLAKRSITEPDNPEDDPTWVWQSQGQRTVTTFLLKNAIYKAKEYSIDGDSVMLPLSLEVDDQEYEVQWVFTSVTEKKLGENNYSGVGWKFQTNGLDSAVWLHINESVAAHTDDWFFTQTWKRFHEKQVGDENTIDLPDIPDEEKDWYSNKLWYNGDTLPFFFMAGENGSTVSYFQDPVAARVAVTDHGDTLSQVFEIPLGTGTNRETPMKYWLFCEQSFETKWKALDEWTSVYDFIAKSYHDLLSLEESVPVPTLEWISPSEDYWNDYRDNGMICEDLWLVRLSETVIPEAADLGIKVVYIQVPWKSDAEYSESEYLPKSMGGGSGHAPWRLEISKAVGGMEGMKILTQKAHDLGLKIVLWVPPNHLSDSSPLLHTNPEWIKWKQNGSPEDAMYGDIVGTSLKSGWYDYVLAQYQNILNEAGADGVWMDSFLTFVMYPDFSQQQPEPELIRAANLQSEFWKMGMSEVRIEGNGFLGLSTGGFGNEYYSLTNPDPGEVAKARAAYEKDKGKEYGFYKYIAGTIVENDSYYRTLASKGVVSIAVLSQLDELFKVEEEHQRFIRANSDHAKVTDKMEKRKLIGDGDTWNGVSWTRSDSSEVVLFAFTDSPYSLTETQTVRDITIEEDVDTKSGFTPTPFHTYVISESE